MSSLLTTTQIANLALDHLNEAPLTQFDTDATHMGRWFRRNFWPIAWAVMRKHPWNFAIARAKLPANPVVPAFGWSYAYDLPGDVLRVLPLTDDGSENGRPVPHKVEGSQILTDQPPPRPVRYIRRVDNTGLFDQQFVDVLAASLAQKAAHVLTGKQSFAQVMGQLATSLMIEAQAIDALEGSADDPIDSYWVDARRA